MKTFKKFAIYGTGPDGVETHLATFYSEGLANYVWATLAQLYTQLRIVKS